jgi:hypothetical protein
MQSCYKDIIAAGQTRIEIDAFICVEAARDDLTWRQTLADSVHHPCTQMSVANTRQRITATHRNCGPSANASANVNYVRSEVLMAVNMKMWHRVVRFQKNLLPLTPSPTDPLAAPFPFLLSLYTDVFPRGLFFHSEDVAGRFLRNVGKFAPDYTASHSRRHEWPWTIFRSRPANCSVRQFCDALHAKLTAASGQGLYKSVSSALLLTFYSSFLNFRIHSIYIIFVSCVVYLTTLTITPLYSVEW